MMIDNLGECCHVTIIPGIRLLGRRGDPDRRDAASLRLRPPVAAQLDPLLAEAQRGAQEAQGARLGQEDHGRRPQRGRQLLPGSQREARQPGLLFQ